MCTDEPESDAEPVSTEVEPRVSETDERLSLTRLPAPDPNARNAPLSVAALGDSLLVSSEPEPHDPIRHFHASPECPELKLLQPAAALCVLAGSNILRAGPLCGASRVSSIKHYDDIDSAASCFEPSFTCACQLRLPCSQFCHRSCPKSERTHPSSKSSHQDMNVIQPFRSAQPFRQSTRSFLWYGHCLRRNESPHSSK